MLMWIALAIAAPMAGAIAWFLVSALPVRRMTRHLSYDSEGITSARGRRCRGGPSREWEVRTTGAGPWLEDFWIILEVDGRGPVRIPEPLAPIVLGGLQTLPGFDNEMLLKATGTVTKARFVCWTRPTRRAVPANPALQSDGRVGRCAPSRARR